MKRVICFLACIALLMTGCKQPDHYNYPVLPDTPEPAPLTGTFVSEHGSLTFNGDAKSVIVDIDEVFSQATGVPVGEFEGEYIFFQALPPHGHVDVRYDAGYGFDVFVNDDTYSMDIGYASEDGKTGSVYLGIVEENKIPIMIRLDDKFTTVLFEKK